MNLEILSRRTISHLTTLLISAAMLPATTLARPGKPHPPGPDVVISEADCTVEKLGTVIPAGAIGEPVSAVTLDPPIWFAASGQNPAYCRVNGSMSPIDPASPDINFGVTLPSVWTHRAVQVGGGGLNGSVPGLTGGGYLGRGWAVSGSDSGHQGSGGGTWADKDEPWINLGYAQMKKTHDAAWVLIDRMYDSLPVYSYWVGGSQGGREGLTVAQRYPADYDGVLITVPIVNFSSLMLSRALHRIQEIPLENWVTNAKRTAISTYVIRKCDGLDGIMDGIINNYNACRTYFDVTQSPVPDPWAEKRCPSNIDPDPADTSANACLTDGQISTMEFVHQKYFFATPLAHKNKSFGMWVPNTDPGGNGMIVTTRYQGQEGAGDNAAIYNWLGGPGVMGALFQDLGSDPLTYVEGGELNDRRKEISEWLDATDPKLHVFRAFGNKIISFIGTNDTLASSGSQLDYYQSLIDQMGTRRLSEFARLYVIPSAGHGLSGNNYNVDGNGDPIPTRAIPNGGIDRLQTLIDWVEDGISPPDDLALTAGGRSFPLCEYPSYPRYLGGDQDSADSYSCEDW